MNTKQLVLTTLLSCLFVPAWADEVPGQPNPWQGEALRGQPVRNAPYSAEGIQETQRNLADGNQIVTKVNTVNYRDSQGNTRQETRSPGGEVQNVMIHSAAENINYTLVPLTHVAFKMDQGKLNAKAAAFGAAYGAAAGAAIKARFEAQRKEGKPLSIDNKELEEIVVKRMPPNAKLTPNVAPMIAAAMSEAKWSSKASTKDLGAKNIDGVKAEGKLRSYEIPAGEVGNRKAIVVTDETWFSPELQITLYAKHSDARSGDVVYRLANLKRGEQAAALFAVPSDYTVNDITPATIAGF